MSLASILLLAANQAKTPILGGPLEFQLKLTEEEETQALYSDKAWKKQWVEKHPGGQSNHILISKREEDNKKTWSMENSNREVINLHSTKNYAKN